jgi:DNA-binding MarR family transcriptional regulator
MTETATGNDAGTSQQNLAAADLPRERVLASLIARLEVHRRLAEHRSPLGVAEGRLLWLLSDRRPRTLREIADALGLEQSTVNRQVNGALAAGLVRRFAEPGRAGRLVEPTDVGLESFERATTYVLGAYEESLAALGEAEARQFLAQLDTFVDAYGEAVRKGDW